MSRSDAIRILLSDEVEPSTSTSVRHNGDVLDGHIEITSALGELSVRVRFEGITRTWISSSAQESVPRPSYVGGHQFLCQTENLDSVSTKYEASTAGHHHVVPFKFVIPARLIDVYSNVHPQFLGLPPSSHHGACYRGPDGIDYMQPLINYSLTASVSSTASSRDSTRVITLTRDVCILPLSTASPPTQLEDFHDDYHLSTNKILRPHMWSKSLGALAVSSKEPLPFNILTSEPRATSVMHLKLDFLPEADSGLGVCPFEWTYHVQYQLLSTTFYATRPFRRAPSKNRSRANAHSRFGTSLVTSEKRLLHTPSWRLDRLGEEGTIVCHGRQKWTGRLDLPVSAPKALQPTFLIQLAARRYSIRVVVKVAGMHHGVLELEVPVQVIADPVDDGRIATNLGDGINQDSEGQGANGAEGTDDIAPAVEVCRGYSAFSLCQASIFAVKGEPRDEVQKKALQRANNAPVHWFRQHLHPGVL